MAQWKRFMSMPHAGEASKPCRSKKPVAESSAYLRVVSRACPGLATRREPGGRALGARQQVQHAKRECVLLEVRHQARAEAAALLLLADDTKGNLEEASRRVRLEDDAADDAPHLFGRARHDERVVVRREEHLCGIRAANERQRRVDELEQVVQQVDVLQPAPVVAHRHDGLVAASRVCRIARVLEHLWVHLVATRDTLWAQPRPLRHRLHLGLAAALVVAVGATQAVAEQDLVALQRLAARANQAVRVVLRVALRGDGCDAVRLSEGVERTLRLRLERDGCERPLGGVARGGGEIERLEDEPRRVVEDPPVVLVVAARDVVRPHSTPSADDPTPHRRRHDSQALDGLVGAEAAHGRLAPLLVEDAPHRRLARGTGLARQPVGVFALHVPRRPAHVRRAPAGRRRGAVR
mmetsp:Transcript_11337/g.35834  ORF Transcript_11337/g.35834 Transcript_11337/m.35834 type:complete len:409 (+) Transcript_11337:415-1641(+)